MDKFLQGSITEATIPRAQAEKVVITGIQPVCRGCNQTKNFQIAAKVLGFI